MQQVIFRTVEPQMEITVNDCGTSAITYTSGYTLDGSPVITTEILPYLELFNFDGNSLGTKADTVTCIGMAGQHTIGTPQIQPRTLVLTLAFDGRGGGRDTDAKMYALRRIITRCFQPGKTGTIEYTNDNGTYFIDCYPNEYPNIERQAGTRTVTSFYFTADFPYWHRDVTVGPHVFNADVTKEDIVNTICHGDIESPIIGEIKCISSMENPTGHGYDGAIFGLYRTDDAEKVLFGAEGMKFKKPLLAGDILAFNTGLNNEVYFKLKEGRFWERPANEYYDSTHSKLHRIKPGLDRWIVGMYTLSGTVEATLHYQELFLSV